jgi:hypothetical protein
MKFWDDHGTKIMGAALGVSNAIQAADLYLSQIMTMKQHAILSAVNMTLSTAIVKRGFTNSSKTP